MEKYCWINGREVGESSSAFGEVIVDPVFIIDNPRKNLYHKVFEVNHGHRIKVIDEYFHKEKSRKYLRIQYEDRIGWVLDSFVSNDWSLFIFIGTISPQQSYEDFNAKYQYGGYKFDITKDIISIETYGDPSEFNSIRFAIVKILQSLTYSQTMINDFPIEFNFRYWVEVGISDHTDKKVVGRNVDIFDFHDKDIDIEQSRENIHLLPQTMKFPHLFLSMNDYFQARKFPQHSLIFLSRAIESIENYFGYFYGGGKEDIGKEKLLREKLCVSANKVNFVTSKANKNTYHSRHASKEGEVQLISKEELNKCFQITKNIILSFNEFLSLSQ
jgi:hypothetical protein